MVFNMDQCDVNKTSEEAKDSLYSTVSLSVILLFLPAVTAFGMLCNSAFIYVVYRIKSMRNATNIFLVNLAVADSLLLVAAFCQYIGSYINSPDYHVHGFSFHSKLECIVPNFLVYLCYYTSLWTVTLVSIERYIALCRPFWYKLVSGKRKSLRKIFAAWCISGLFASLTIPYTNSRRVCIVASDGVEQYSQCTRNCYQEGNWCNMALYASDLAQYLFALIINVVLYGCIVRQTTKSSFFSLPLHEKRAHQMRILMMKMLMVNCFIFFICLLPFSIINLDAVCKCDWFSWKDTFSITFVWTARILFLLNSALNSIVYVLVNPVYRAAFKQAFCFVK